MAWARSFARRRRSTAASRPTDGTAAIAACWSRLLTRLAARFRDRLTLRVSLDHYTADLHDAERGEGSFAVTLEGMRWLRDAGIGMAVAGRTLWDEDQGAERDGYARLFAAEGFDIDAQDPAHCVLFPEMDETVDVPEITTACWGIMGKCPDSVMCASASR